MSYVYTPTPARSEPATISGRRLSTDANCGIHYHITLPRRTYSVPTAFPTRPTQKPRRAGLALLGIGLPSTRAGVTGFHPRPERPRLQRQAGPGLDTPFTAVPMRSMRRRVAGSFPMSPTARSRSGTTHGLGLAMQREGSLPLHAEDAPHPAITLTLADAFDSEGEEEEFGHAATAAEEEQTHALGPRYSFLPPGLSSPVPWPSSPVDEAPPAELALAAATQTARPMIFRRLASPAMRVPVPADDPAMPGAPLSPSLSRFGTHHHFPGLDHSPGGAGDEDALLAGMTGAVPSRSRTRMPMTPPNAPRTPWVERFSSDRLYHQYH